MNIKKSVAFCNSNKQLENIMGKDCLWSTIKKMKQLQNHEMCWTDIKNKVKTIRDRRADERLGLMPYSYEKKPNSIKR